MQLEVVEFIKNNANWKALLMKEPYCIDIKEDSSYYLLKYNQVKSDMSLNIVQECRGLILDKESLSPKALSFKKFFNYGEPNASNIDWQTAKVQEKLDGSKILCWFDKKWHISTSGTIDAYGASVSNLGYTFGDLFDEAIMKAGFKFISEFYDMLDKNCCYTFELVSPKAPIVINYKETDIYFIGKRNMQTLDEIMPENESLVNIKLPKLFKLNSLENCINAADKLGLKQEGFVVIDSQFRRIKIKGAQYLIAHYLNNNGVQSQARLLEIVERNEIDEFCNYFPVWRDKLEEIKQVKNKFFSTLKSAIHYSLDFKIGCLDNDPEKETALYIQNFFPLFSGFIFKFLKCNLTDYFIEHEWSDLSIDKKLKYLNAEMQIEEGKKWERGKDDAEK